MIRQLCVVALLISAVGQTVADDTPNDKVVAYAKSQIGKQVDDGECWTLANQAMKTAGLKSSFDYTDSPNTGDSVWGDLVYGRDIKDNSTMGALKDVKAGDVVQFRDVKLSGRRGNTTYTMTATQHTAIVVKANNATNQITVLHQNWNGNKTVAEATLSLGDLKAGWIKIYHPKPK